MADYSRCVVCDGELGDEGPWIALNRWVAWNGRVRTCSEFRDVDDDYVWDIDREDGEDLVSCRAMHWPRCAIEYIEAKMIEYDVDAAAGGL